MKASLSSFSRLWPIAKRRMAAGMISAVEKLLLREKLIRNVFGSSHKKRVLLCHMPEAFKTRKLPKYHSNITECYAIAQCFDRLGYRVDCSSRAKKGIDYSPYDIVFGINGNAFFGSFTARCKENEPLRIFYSVGAHTCYNYTVTVERNREMHERHGLWLLGSNRYIPGDARNYYEAHFSDAVICLGNDFVRSFFEKDDARAGHYKSLPAFFFPVAEPSKDKDFEKCRRNLLWFGSMGMVHKGLDIAIDFAVAHPEYRLHICGGSSQERGFWDLYNPVLKEHDNIVMHGFVDIESEKFREILSECSVLVNPSISESGAVAVLNVLGNGALLPVCSEATGIELSSAGIGVPSVTYSSFEAALLAAGEMSPGELKEKAWAAHRFVLENYTLEKYKENMYNILKDITENNDKL